MKMRRVKSAVVAGVLTFASLLACAATPAHAYVDLALNQYSLNGSIPGGSQLATNKWIAYSFSLFAGGGSSGIAGFNFASPAGVGPNLTGQNWGFFGTFHQTWQQSPAGPITTPVGSYPIGSPSDGNDTHWITFTPSLGFTAGIADLENSNLSYGGSTPPYDHSPLLADLTNIYGVGSAIKLSGTFSGTPQTLVPLIYVVVPNGTTLIAPAAGEWTPNFGFHGIAYDTVGNAFPLNFGLSEVSVPEPTTLSLLTFPVVLALVRFRTQKTKYKVTFNEKR